MGLPSFSGSKKVFKGFHPMVLKGFSSVRYVFARFSQGFSQVFAKVLSAVFEKWLWF